MFKPNEFERHIILYCKGWYKVTNLVDDVRAIIAEVSGSELQHIDLGHVYGFITQVATNYVGKYDMQEFFKWLFLYNKNPDSVTVEEACMKLAGKIAIITVKDKDVLLMDLGEPDYSILDRKDEAV